MMITGKKGIVVGLVVLIAIVTSAYFFAQNVTLTCYHSIFDNTVNCVRQTSVLGFISLGTDQIHDVRGATVTETDGGEDGTGYRLELITAQGNVPLTSGYYQGMSGRQEIAGRISDFVANGAAAEELVITDPGLFTGGNLPNMLLPILLPLGYFLYSKARKDEASDTKFVPYNESMNIEAKSITLPVTTTPLITSALTSRVRDDYYVETRLRLLRAGLIIFVIGLVFIQLIGFGQLFQVDFLGMTMPMTIAAAIVAVVGYTVYHLWLTRIWPFLASRLF